jgi:hypothetical protein
MKNLIKADVIQLVTTRTALGWVISIAAFMLLGGVMLAILASFGAQMDGRVAIPIVGDFSELDFIRRREFNPLVFLFVLIVVSGNYRHRVAVTERLVCGNFWKATLSKMIVFGAAGAIISVCQTAVLALPLLVWPGLHISLGVGTIQVVMSYALLSTFAAMCAVALGRLLKHQVVVVLVGLVYVVVLDPILRNQLLWEFLKVNTKFREVIVQSVPGEAFMNLNTGLPVERLLAAGILLSWILTLCFTGYLLDRHRDWR